MDPRLLGLVLLLVSGASLGSGALFAKGVYAGSELGFLTLMLWRFLLGAGATWLWILSSDRRRTALRAVTRRTVAVGIGLGLLYVLSSGSYYAGLETVPASLAALIVFITPPLNAVLSLRFGRRYEGSRAWFALGLALAGGVLAVGGIPDDAMPPVGSLVLIALGPLSYSFWLIIQAWLSGERTGERAGEGDGDAPRRREDAEPVVVAAFINSGAVLGYLAVTGAAGQPLAPSVADAAVWPFIAGIGIVSTFIAMITVSAGIRLLGAARASLVSVIEPLWTILLSALLLGESLTPVQLAGGVLIVAGVILAQGRGALEAQAPAPAATEDEPEDATGRAPAG